MDFTYLSCEQTREAWLSALGRPPITVFWSVPVTVFIWSGWWMSFYPAKNDGLTVEWKWNAMKSQSDKWKSYWMHGMHLGLSTKQQEQIIVSLTTSFGHIPYSKEQPYRYKNIPYCNKELEWLQLPLAVMYHTHYHITECIGKLEVLFQNVKRVMS